MIEWISIVVCGIVSSAMGGCVGWKRMGERLEVGRWDGKRMSACMGGYVDWKYEEGKMCGR